MAESVDSDIRPNAINKSSITFAGIKPEVFESLVDEYKRRKPNRFLDLDKLSELGDISGIAAELSVNLTNGIPESEVAERRALYGSNRNKPPDLKGFWAILWNVMKDFTLRILLISSLVSIVINEIFEEPKSIVWIDGFGIFVAVVVVALVSTFNDWRKEQQFAKLNEIAEDAKKVAAVRDGKLNTETINEGDIVVGDVIKIITGKSIPADGILISGKGVEVDESAMTGESNLMKKRSLEECTLKIKEMHENKDVIDDMNMHSIPTPILLSGTYLRQGEGYYLVIVVGEKSAIGKIRKDLQNDEERESPLQLKLTEIASNIGKLGLIVAIATVLVLFIRWLVTRCSEGGWAGSDVGLVFSFFILGLTVLVVAVPEGLPLAVTISLAYSIGKMYEQNNFVKQLTSCETMGGADNICSDKTGTLTKNKMVVLKIMTDSKNVLLSDSEPKYQINDIIPDKDLRECFIECCIVNSTATATTGDATEIALFNFLEGKLNYEVEKERVNRHKNEYVRLYFNSKRKKMSTIMLNSQSSTGHRIYTKGAAEIIINSCTQIQTSSGVEPLNDVKKTRIFEDVKSFNLQALRTIALAYRDLPKNEYGPNHDEKSPEGKYFVEENNLVFLGLVGIRDTLRDNVKEAVETCNKAGITVRMVTGDNKMTAFAIAKECGILPSHLKFEDNSSGNGTYLMEGPEFNDTLGGLEKICTECQDVPCVNPEHKKKEVVKNFEIFKSIETTLRVIARSRPEDKYLLVTGLRQLNKIVAVTGDGTNDAPALKKADVGFAMGIAGTDVAKEAAHIVLLDDNFASIIVAVKWGRNIYINIRKFIQFQVSVNIVALASAFIGSCITKESPLSPIQLLWVNLIMDSLASLVLATDSPTDDLLNMMPLGKEESVITRYMTKHITGQSIYMIAVLFVILFAGEYFIPEDDCELSGYPMSLNGKTVRTGRRYTYKGEEYYNKSNKKDPATTYYHQLEIDAGPSRHFTFFFATFVFMQIFNQVNCKGVNEELNLIAKLIDNWFSAIIIGVEILVQVLFVEFFGIAFNINVKGLNWAQWLIVIGFSIITVILRTILVLVTSKIFPQCGKTLATDPSQSIVGTLRRHDSSLKNKSGAKENSQKNKKKSSVRISNNQVAPE